MLSKRIGVRSIAAVVVLWVSGGQASSQTFRGAVPDFYQHQRWGDGTDGDPMQKATWQFEGGSFGGWCFHASMVDVLYARYAKDKAGKYKNLLPAAIDGAAWLSTANDEIEAFKTAYRTKQIDQILKDRIGAPDHTKKEGLVNVDAALGSVGGAPAIVYVSASAGKVFRAPYSTASLVNAVVEEHDKRGHEIVMIVEPTPGESYPKSLWWAQGTKSGNFHALAIVGHDTTDATKPKLWFADPDCNKGNNDADAIFDAKKRKPDAAFKAKRYVAMDAFPIPGDPKDRKQYNWYEFDPTDGRTMASTDGADNRYNKIRIRRLVMIQTAQAYNKAGPAPSLMNQWAITAGDDVAVDEFWVFPNAPLNVAVNPTFDVHGVPWDFNPIADLLHPGEPDPWGNVRDFGGFRFRMPDGADPLLPIDGDWGDLDFWTTSEMTGLDVLFKDFGTNEWTFQVYGKTYEILPDQSGPCPADCNGDGSLNTLDFLCFLSLYAAGDPEADCNGDTVVNTLDFLCFLNLYSLGCD
ncbi:MAG TPA: GC-type dockerin domain-anchored protein [Phycisphaerales bacterium]|nr:GC-type dockerin domain-anchored protein [Phycisphaerales bacterium]